MRRFIFFAAVLFSLTLFMQTSAAIEELDKLEAEFDDLKAKSLTLEEFSPDKSPGFENLEKTNQLVERLDFSDRKFRLLLAQFNLITDKFFPLCREYFRSGQFSSPLIMNRLGRFTGSGPDSLVSIQRELNRVILKKSRIEKDIEMVQVNRKYAETGREEKSVSKPSAEGLSLAVRIDLLQNELKETEKTLGEQNTRLEELKKDERSRNDKIEEKTAETKKLRDEAGASGEPVVRLIGRTNADAIELRVNGLEIPLHNMTRTMIYLANTKISALNEKRTETEKEIELLRKRKNREFRKKIIKGIIVVFIAVFIVLFLIKLSKKISGKTLKRIEESERFDSHRKQRYVTLSSVILSFVKIALWVSALVWVLGMLSIDYGPLLLAAGGISLAIGFGAQYLVRDIVTGFFLLMEEQFALGDVVEINGKTGVIEKISLRTIKFRALDGTMHIIPNGEISIISNLTYLWSRAVVDIGVSYNEDSTLVMNTLKAVCAGIFNDNDWKGIILEEPTAQGIISFGESAVNYRILARTKTGEQWSVAREINIRIQKAFNENDIEIPYKYINVINIKQEGGEQRE